MFGNEKLSVRGKGERKRILLPLLLVLFLWGSSWQNHALFSQRLSTGLTDPSEVEDAPPMVAFTTILLGGFRGIVADILWIRVSQLQDRGQYFELVQLADWITKLEPRCSAIWGFHGWNLAYNISAAMSEDEDRWRWVQNGIHLLRDEGLRYNPSDPGLYRELGWIFQHKIGDTADSSHAYYKQQWAAQVRNILPDGKLTDEITPESPVATQLKETLGLGVGAMRELERRYGAMDWRHPHVQSLYWATQGLNHARHGKHVPCDRMVYQSLAALFFHGKLREADDGSGVRATPRYEIFETAASAYESAIARYDDDTMREAYFNFLLRSIGFLQAHHQEERAKKVYQRLHERFPDRVAAPDFDRSS